MKQVLKAVWKFLCFFDTFVPMLGVGVMGIALFIQIIMRYVVGIPLTWTDELARYSYVWVCFAGLSYCCRNHTNIRMEAVIKILPPRFRKILLIILNIISIAVFSYLLPFAATFAKSQFNARTPALAIPKGFISISVPIGFGLLIINLLVQTIVWIGKKPDEISVSGSH
jgi:TRAP-type C4-dicarboxylate transport system permease small subunit